jgi:deoxyribonucleoside regulator
VAIRIENKARLLVEISKWYYHFNMSQLDIARRLGISRAYVSNLLSEAKKTGIVEVIIHDPLMGNQSLKEEFETLFRLDKVIIVPSGGKKQSSPLSIAAREAGKYLNAIVSSGMTIGYSWGYTIYVCSNSLVHRKDIKDVTVVPLCGGVSDLNCKVYSSEISRNIAAAYNGSPLILPIPAVFENSRMKKMILQDATINKILQQGRNADVALFTVGSFGMENSVYQSGYVSDTEMDTLIKKGCVGDICTRFITFTGEICSPELDDRTVAINLQELKNIKRRICVAVGIEKVKSLIGALQQRYCNILVSDEETLWHVIRECKSLDSSSLATTSAVPSSPAPNEAHSKRLEKHPTSTLGEKGKTRP